MRSLRPVIASNGLAIALTIVFVLPITGVLAYVVTTPLDAWMENLGVWLHEANGWSASLLDTQERFAKVGFAIRSIVIAVGLSFMYFGISNWLNAGMARFRTPNDPGSESTIVEAIQPWIFVGPALVLLILFLLIPAFSTLSL